jgi:hypothetical protein
LISIAVYRDNDVVIIAVDSTGIKVTNRGLQWMQDKWHIKRKVKLKNLENIKRIKQFMDNFLNASLICYLIHGFALQTFCSAMDLFDCDESVIFIC